MLRLLNLVLMLLFVVLCQTAAAVAHYPILIGDRSPIISKMGETYVLTYGRGHLYDPKWTEAPEPDWIRAYTADGMTLDLKSIARTEDLTIKLNHSVKHPGDTWIVYHTPLEWSDHDRAWTESTVRTIIHLKLFLGWKEPIGLPLEIVPMTRPYGIMPGDTFSTQLLYEGKPLSGATIHAEKYYMPPMKKPYPPDEIITRTAQTDPMGRASLTLHSPGWWILFTSYEEEEIAKDGKEGPVLMQDGLWVYVEPVLKPGKE